MFVGCSEISISVAVQRWNYQGFLSAWQELLRFLVPGRTEKIVGSWFAWGIGTQADTMPQFFHKDDCCKSFI